MLQFFSAVVAAQDSGLDDSLKTSLGSRPSKELASDDFPSPVDPRSTILLTFSRHSSTTRANGRSFTASSLNMSMIAVWQLCVCPRSTFSLYSNHCTEDLTHFNSVTRFLLIFNSPRMVASYIRTKKGSNVTHVLRVQNADGNIIENVVPDISSYNRDHLSIVYTNDFVWFHLVSQSNFVSRQHWRGKSDSGLARDKIKDNSSNASATYSFHKQNTNLGNYSHIVKIKVLKNLSGLKVSRHVLKIHPNSGSI